MTFYGKYQHGIFHEKIEKNLKRKVFKTLKIFSLNSKKKNRYII